MIKVVGKTWWKTVKASKNISSVRQWYMEWVMTTFWARKMKITPFNVCTWYSARQLLVAVFWAQNMCITPFHTLLISIMDKSLN